MKHTKHTLINMRKLWKHINTQDMYTSTHTEEQTYIFMYAGICMSINRHICLQIYFAHFDNILRNLILLKYLKNALIYTFFTHVNGTVSYTLLFNSFFFKDLISFSSLYIKIKKVINLPMIIMYFLR